MIHFYKFINVEIFRIKVCMYSFLLALSSLLEKEIENYNVFEFLRKSHLKTNIEQVKLLKNLACFLIVHQLI